MQDVKILLVDDEAEFASTLAERLELRGYRVTTAHDGEEALQIVQDDPPEAVILDVRMPGLGGLEVLKRIKMDRRDLPVILLTGVGSTKDGIEGMQLGAFDYLMKPIQIEELTEKIREAVGNPLGSEQS